MVVQTEAAMLPEIVQLTLDQLGQTAESLFDLSIHLEKPDPMPPLPPEE